MNLDLVQFPKPVYITEVRIIPLGARVQADFPGGVRLGATNPSQFHVDFFVNDLERPGASTFENLGSFEYNQNDCINLECSDSSDENIRQIPTDGLVLRGWYTTITLAVYGTFTKVITEQIASPPATTPQPPPIIAPVEIPPVLDVPETEEDWDANIVPVETIEPAFVSKPTVIYTETFEKRDEYYGSSSDVPKDPRISDWSHRPEPGSGNDSTMDRSDHDWDRVEHRSRRKSRSIERPLSREVSRTREKELVYSISPSREKEYTSRLKRDWSRSPEYRSHRKGRESSYELSRNYDKHRSSDSDEPRKRPRTPPIVASPRRPRTPDSRPSDDELRFTRIKSDKSSKHHTKIRIIDHSTSEDRKIASPISVNENIKSPPPPPIDDGSESPTIEQFEPILSDEEIGDEAESFEIDYDINEYDEILKIFNPFEDELKRFEMENNNPTAHQLSMEKEFDAAVKIIHKFNSRSDKFSCNEFLNINPDGKECWVHFAEQLIQSMNQFNNDSFFRNENNKFISEIIKDEIVKMTIYDWIKIGLNFEFALSQPQPGYKIRHIKAGVRLIEVLLCYDDIADLILNQNQFDVFSQLLSTYDQKHMALSIKLMILKAIHSSIDSKVAIEYFLNDDFNENGYRMILKKLENNPLTRIKFALKSLIKKVNLYESLKTVRDVVQSQVESMVKDHSAEINEADLIMLKSCLNEIYAALTYDTISYSQPKRFLPVSAKFDCGVDVTGYNSVYVGFLSHFKVNAFLESLLFLLTHQYCIKNFAIVKVYDILKRLLSRLFGIEYLIDNIDTTNLMLKVLFGMDKSDETGFDCSTPIEIGCEIAFKVSG